MPLSGAEQVQHRALLVRGQELGLHGGGLAFSLRQQVILVLNDRPLHGALDLGGQAVFQIEALSDCLRRGRAGGQSIQRIVVVVAQHSGLIGWHGEGS
ncbi:hypothetical protein PMm318_A07390 [Pseudomonas moorei]